MLGDEFYPCGVYAIMEYPYDPSCGISANWLFAPTLDLENLKGFKNYYGLLWHQKWNWGLFWIGVPSHFPEDAMA